MRTFGYMALFQGLYYLIVSTNILFLANHMVGPVIATDAVGSLVNYGLIQHIAKAEGKWATAGYVIGGAIGSGLSIPLVEALIR